MSSRGLTLTEATLGLLVFIVVGYAFLLAIGQVMHQVNLGNIEMSAHAANGHTGQPNATSIKEKINNGQCPSLQAYVCPREQTIKIMCGQPGAASIEGLIIGVTNAAEIAASNALPAYTKVVTGYKARNSYWESNLGECITIPITMLPQ